MGKKSKSPWVWVGCGCAVLAGILLIAIGAAVVFGLRTAATMADPVALRDKALKTLSAQAIPDGYEPRMAMKVPFYAEVVVLQGDKRQFVYLSGLRTKADLSAAFADDESFDEQLRRAGLQIKPGQTVLARDALRVGAAEIRYVLIDGEIHFDGGRSRSVFDFDISDLGDTPNDGSAPEQGAAVLIRCSEDDQPGLGLWMAPRTDSLIDFVEQFGLCEAHAPNSPSS